MFPTSLDKKRPERTQKTNDKYRGSHLPLEGFVVINLKNEFTLMNGESIPRFTGRYKKNSFTVIK